MEVDLDSYVLQVRAAVERLLSGARCGLAEALYLEFDLDNGWSTGAFVCPSYDAVDDEWACEYTENDEGGSIERFSALLKHANTTYGRCWSNPGDHSYGDLLCARTISAVGRALDLLDLGDLFVGVAYHDGAVWTIRGPDLGVGQQHHVKRR